MYALPDLPYGYDSLGPFMSADTLRTHHDKHHKTYVDKTNDLAAKAGLAGRPLEEVVREAHKTGDKKLFNNAAQAWNHAVFWESMRPPGGDAPSGALLRAITDGFGDLASLKGAFVDEGANHFASGWVWIVTGSDGLKVISTHDADDTLIKEGLFPLLVCDVWEHAYYLDYKNDRKAFLERWFDNIANWAFAADQLAASDGKGDGFRYPAPGADPAKGDKGDAPRPTA
ncbi:MAG: superoxide dismutase [Alphaproteobacteria bacterium]|nr:superoxide dismutase [Alphaproteobacteria bacterium]MBU1513111.1 superoxide dismutase [Alphaproteobacteria bacterium]MBU2095219.1 superoxide dismutase [Alphaproteobacteria bacterium]MBU2150622.1 superoxide dismutase [Alphaproteobacteria bacterium]MBU2306119.1 superoxide dismutase [Alphaproteobacteria bacterium]